VTLRPKSISTTIAVIMTAWTPIGSSTSPTGALFERNRGGDEQTKIVGLSPALPSTGVDRRRHLQRTTQPE